MTSKSAEKKIGKKQKRCQHMLSNETNIECTNEVTSYLAVCNAGLATGLQVEILTNESTKFGKVADIVMQPGKSYCFIKCLDKINAQQIYDGMHGKAKLAQHDNVLYLTYCLDVPKIDNVWEQELPPGLILLEDFITENEEICLLNSIDWTLSDNAKGNTLKHRMVKHYGYEFQYGSNDVNINEPLSEKFPSKCSVLWPRLKEKLPDLKFIEPNQLTVNKYLPGHGIPTHCDTHSAFESPLLSLSLGSDIVMNFRTSSIVNNNERLVNVHLPRRSMLIMSGESRYGWTHSITPRKTDIVPGVNGSLTVVQREIRVSFTFRILKENKICDCNFPLLCDYAKKCTNRQDDTKLELENVHKVYDDIANHFSETRHSPWPKVEQFVSKFLPGDTLIDIGCGNGKYLQLNDGFNKIGCDRSMGLLNVCRQRKLNVFQCDCLQIPIRDNSVNGCISIAVIHHLASQERRLKAIQEMARILVIGGQGLIYVWAKNQSLKNQKSSYLRQNKRNNKPEPLNQATITETIEYVDGLPIHTNRTQFQHQDILVPWKLKSAECPAVVEKENCKTFLRFYHVFEENELESLCASVPDIKIIQNYYDQGNWCIIFEKI